MQIFLDTANVDEIRRWMGQGVVDGVTTNPTIMLNDGVADVEPRAVELAALISPRPLSIEVTTNDRHEMIQQAHLISRWAPNIVVKIPVITTEGTPCLDVVQTLEEQGIATNVTACLSFGQAALAAKAGATYVSLFAGRIADEGHDPAAVIQITTDWIRRWKYKGGRHRRQPEGSAHASAGCGGRCGRANGHAQAPGEVGGPHVYA